MIALAPAARTDEDRFLNMLPQIRRQANTAFRNEPPASRQELVSEVIANSWTAFIRLVERGLDDVIYPTPLAQFAVKQVRSGRHVGTPLNIHDISSSYCQRSKRVTLERLDVFDAAAGGWKDIVVEDRTAGPAEIAAMRIDFHDWLMTLPRLKRRVARVLAVGETTGKTARRFHVTPGRISQLRRELEESWQGFQAEAACV